MTSYDSNGTTQTFVVPPLITALTVIAAGGNGGCPWAVAPPAQPTSGGLGAEVTATIPVTPGETLTLQVGEAGRYGAITGTNGDRYGGSPSGTAITGLGGYPDGGTGGRTGSSGSFYGGGGGGSTRVWRGGVGGTLLICAAGGGGIGFSDGFTDIASPTTTGNGGQPTPGQNGRNVDRVGTALLNPGIGATSIAGGAGGSGGSSGSSFSGGNGANYTASPVTYSGGGGGGGLYGGGGGGREIASLRNIGSQGGGGSSYVIGTASSITWGTNIRTASGGNPEALHTVQSGGYVVITYSSLPPTTDGWSLGLVKLMG